MQKKERERDNMCQCYFLPNTDYTNYHLVFPGKRWPEPEAHTLGFQ